MINSSCAICGNEFIEELQWRVYCNECRKLVLRLQTHVSRQMKMYKIPPASSHKCVDCGLQANAYDHRYYSLPLEVEPVCTRCNIKRGPAVDLVHCLHEFAQYGIVVKYGKPEMEAIAPLYADTGVKLFESIEMETKNRIEKALIACEFNRTKAARVLGITFRQMRYQISKLGVVIPN